MGCAVVVDFAILMVRPSPCMVRRMAVVARWCTRMRHSSRSATIAMLCQPFHCWKHKCVYHRKVCQSISSSSGADTIVLLAVCCCRGLEEVNHDHPICGHDICYRIQANQGAKCVSVSTHIAPKSWQWESSGKPQWCDLPLGCLAAEDVWWPGPSGLLIVLVERPIAPLRAAIRWLQKCKNESVKPWGHVVRPAPLLNGSG
jgi:hypothetical protein